MNVKNALAPQKANKSKQKGFTLVELGIVVAIGAILIGVGIAVVPSIMASQRVNAEISELPQIVTNIQRVFNNQPGFVPLPTVTTLGQLGVFPESRWRADTPAEARNRWGGTITVAASGAVLPNGLSLTYADVPSAECRELIPALSASVRVIQVGGQTVKPDNGSATLADTAARCNAAPTVAIAYHFTK